MNTEPAPDFAVFRSLCQVLGGRAEGSIATRAATPAWPRLVQMAARLDLLPALAVRWRQTREPCGTLGEDGVQLLEQSLLENIRRNMAISAQAVKLARCLNTASIAPLFLKGTAGLLLREDDNIGFRRQVDIDLLVAPGQTAAAADLLLADGYRYCHFPDNSSAVPVEPGVVAAAVRASSAHHHLPPLVKAGYGATVELHTHFLPRRFQKNNPLEPLLRRARTCERHGARFQVASVEHQVIHLVLGVFVNDGHRSRRTFPIRAGCDLLRLLDTRGGDIDHAVVERQCGRSYPLFLRLACELMGYEPPPGAPDSTDVEGFLHLLRERSRSSAIRGLLDVWARTDYLAHELVYSPRKLRGYVQRRLPALVTPARPE